MSQQLCMRQRSGQCFFEFAEGVTMINDIEALKVFAMLCQTGSIQKTAVFLGIENSAASRRIAKLERSIGRTLFDRTKRPFQMTDDAKLLQKPVKQILENLHQIENYYERQRNDESMLVRVMIGNGHINFATKFILEYANLLPKLRFSMIAPTNVDDFLAGKADVINLSGQASLLNCVKIPRGRMIFVPVASPAYIAEHGMVRNPDQLVGHRVFTNLLPDHMSFDKSFMLTKNGVSLNYSAISSIRFSNVEMSHRIVLDGGGIGLSLPLFLCIDDLEAGRLVPILDGWHRPSHFNFVVCKKDDWKIRQIRLFATWWARHCTDYEAECEARFKALFGNKYLSMLQDA